MAITRSTGALIGTSETVGVTILNNATAFVGGANTGDVDLLSNNTSVGDLWLFLAFTGGASAGTIDVTINTHRVTGQAYLKAQADFQIPCISGANLIPLGKRPIDRFVGASILNNGSGASATNVSLLYELETLS